MRCRAPESLQAEVLERMKIDAELQKKREELEEASKDEASVADTQVLPAVPVEHEEKEEVVEKTGLEAVLDGLSSEDLQALLSKHTKDDKRWSKTRQINELIAAGITIADVYSQGD